MWENECGQEFQLSNLDVLPEQILTPEHSLDFSQLLESVLVSLLPESKSIIVAPRSRDTYPDACPDFFDRTIAIFFQYLFLSCDFSYFLCRI